MPIPSEAQANIKRVTVHIECGHWSIADNTKSDKPKKYGSGALISDGTENYFILTALHVVSMKQEPEHVPYCEAYPNGPGTSWVLTLGEPAFPPLAENNYSTDGKLTPVIPPGRVDIQIMKVSDESLDRYLTICDMSEKISQTTVVKQNGYREFKNPGSQKVFFLPQSFRSKPGLFLDKNAAKFGWRSDHKFFPGDSGGPVTNPDGHLIGVIRGQSGAESAFVPVHRFKSVLDSLKIVFDCERAEPTASNGILAGAAVAEPVATAPTEEPPKRLLLTPQYDSSKVWRDSDFERDPQGNRIFLIKFLNGSQKLRDKILELAQEWTASHHGQGVGASLVFTETLGDFSHARITFTDGVVRSYIGRDARNVSGTTAWLPGEDQLFSSSREEKSFFQRLVVHEIGHVLGLLHPNITGLETFVKMKQLDEICRVFGSSVEQCGLVPPNANIVSGDSTVRSIMAYDISERLAKDGKRKHLGAGSPRDADLLLIKRMYP